MFQSYVKYLRVTVQEFFLHYIRKQVVTRFCLIIILFIIGGITSRNAIISLGNLTSTIYKHPLEVSNAALRARMSLVKIHRIMTDIVSTEKQLSIATGHSEVEKEALHNAILEQKMLALALYVRKTWLPRYC